MAKLTFGPGDDLRRRRQIRDKVFVHLTLNLSKTHPFHESTALPRGPATQSSRLMAEALQEMLEDVRNRSLLEPF